MSGRWALIVLLASFCAACGPQLGRNDLKTWHVPDDPANALTSLPLESGQFIVTGSNGRMDMFIGLLPETYMPYVHSGVIVIEDGEPWVYEELASQRPYIGDGPPTANVNGAVRRVRLDKLLNRYFYVDIIDPVDLDRPAIAEFAQYHYAQKTPFDPYFDYAEHESFYCTEFVALALEAGGAPTLPLTRNRENRSARIALDWLGTSGEIMQATTLAEQGRLVARLSKLRTLTEIQVMEALKKELHRRFTCDQKLGNIFLWGGLVLQYRDPVDTYMKKGLELYPADGPVPNAAAAEAAARELADEMFGPFDSRLADAECRCTATECVIPGRARAAAN